MVKFISATQTLPLRSEILRGGLPPEACVFPTDEMEGAFHLGFFAENKLVSVASFLPNSHSSSPDPGYQLRGMATLTGFSGKGSGTALLTFALSQLKVTRATHLWCNARSSAVGFYLKNGFRVVFPEFEIDGIGPHYEMIIDLHA